MEEKQAPTKKEKKKDPWMYSTVAMIVLLFIVAFAFSAIPTGMVTGQGALSAQEAADTMLLHLRAYTEESARSELALALARVIGDENSFIHLSSQCQKDAGTATSQAVTSMQRTIKELKEGTNGLLAAMDKCADALARDDLEQGAADR